MEEPNWGKLVEERRQKLIDLAKNLMQFDTMAPPARNTANAQQFIADYLQQRNWAVDKWEVFSGDPNVVGTKTGKEGDRYNSLILNGHIDVAEVSRKDWSFDPFNPVVKDGWLYGRGAADMKGGLAGLLLAVDILHELKIDLPGDVILQSVVGEEVGEAGTLQCCRRGYTADYALVADTSDLCIQGQGGVITGWVTVKSQQTHHDAMRRNLIHAGGGKFGASAIEKMMILIEGLQSLERDWAVRKTYPGFQPGTNTINPAVIEGGRNAAFIADECSLWITVHFYPDETHETVAAEVENHLRKVAEADPWLRENPPTFIWGGESMIEDRGEIFPSMEVQSNHPGSLQLIESFRDITHETEKINTSPTVTDGGWLADAGIPSSIFGPGTLEEAHAVDEKVEVEQLVTFTKILLSFIYKWSHTLRR